ncbi:MAG: matrixin family metalloprotease [Candidatus Paceibacterota bacterium]
MRNILLLGIFGAFALFLIYTRAPETFSCVAPIYYSIGEFDSRFEITREEFLAVLGDAEQVWEENAGKELFIYREDAHFRVNLIFDERQEKTELVLATEEELNIEQAGYSEADTVYRNALYRYEAAARDLEIAFNKYEVASSAYSRAVSKWNASSKQDRDEYTRLERERLELEEMFESLQVQQRAVESIYKELQEALEYRNALVAEYNKSVNSFNEEFAGGQSFDQGDYTRGQINIYQFQSEDDLRLVLAHEFGHALGIGHVEDEKAIMHYLLGEQSKNPLELTPDDAGGFSTRCSLF